MEALMKTRAGASRAERELTRVVPGACALLVAAMHLGCSDDDGSSDQHSGGGSGAGTAGTTATGGSAGSSVGGTGGGSGAGKGGGSGATNMPGVLFSAESAGKGGYIYDENQTIVGDGPEWLEPLTSHLYAVPGEDGTVVWLAQVMNTGPSIVCGDGRGMGWIQFSASFYDANRMPLSQELLPDGALYGPMYDRASGDAPTMCLEPGATGFAAVYGYFDTPLDPATVAEVRFAVSGVTRPDMSSRAWMTLSDVSMSGAGVTGTLTNGTAEIAAWSVYAFGRSGEAPIAFQSDIEDDTMGSMNISPGQNVPFATPAFGVPVDGFETFYGVVLP